VDLERGVAVEGVGSLLYVTAVGATCDGMFVVLILPTEVTACTYSKVAARSNKQQF